MSAPLEKNVELLECALGFFGFLGIFSLKDKKLVNFQTCQESNSLISKPTTPLKMQGNTELSELIELVLALIFGLLAFEGNN